MRRWTKRLAQVDERPLPSDDPRDVMNEILDDLEDQRSGVPVSASTLTSEPKESKKRTLGDTETTTESAKKQKREGEGKKAKAKAGKAQRKAQKAEKALQAIESAKTDPKQAAAAGKTGGEGTMTTTTTTTTASTDTNTKGLNRKARRLLAHKLKEAEGKGKADKEVKEGSENGKEKGKGEKAVKEKAVKGDPTSATAGVENGKTKSKKSQKST